MLYDKTGSLRRAVEEAIHSMGAGKVAWAEGPMARTSGDLFMPVTE